MEGLPSEFNQVNILRNKGVKYRFPYGQWCTSMEKVDLYNDNKPIGKEFFITSFFDQNISLMRSPSGTTTVMNGNHTLELIASSNLSAQLNTIKAIKNKEKYAVDQSLPSEVFISERYLQSQMLPEK